MSTEEIFKIRQRFIDKKQAALLEEAGLLEQKLLNSILKEFLKNLKAEGGIISFENNQITITNAIDKIFNSFEKNEQIKIADQIANDFGRLFIFNEQYYALLGTQKKVFERIKKNVREVMMQKIGLAPGGEIKPNGFLDQFIKDARLREDVKKLVYNAITRAVPLSDFTESLSLALIGKKGVDGGLTKYYKGFAYDTYQQFDRANNYEFAQELQLKAFIYSGGLIEDSRDFCIKRNNEVFTIEESEEWHNDSTLPRTTAERKSGVLVGYNPLFDCGRWNCRHMVRYITKEMAISRRPDLRTYYEQFKMAA